MCDSSSLKHGLGILNREAKHTDSKSGKAIRARDIESEDAEYELLKLQLKLAIQKKKSKKKATKCLNHDRPIASQEPSTQDWGGIIDETEREEAQSHEKESNISASPHSTTQDNEPENSVDTSRSILQRFYSFIQKDVFVRKLLVTMINNRVQEFNDPLTNTLVLMMNSPIQVVFCEAGIIPFATNNLPVYPYSAMTKNEILFFKDLIHSSDPHDQRDSMESSGQYTLTLCRTKGVLSSKKAHQPNIFLSKEIILKNFVWILFHRNNIYHDKYICKSLCNIILQRLMARIKVSSEIIHNVIRLIDSYFNSEATNAAQAASAT